MTDAGIPASSGSALADRLSAVRAGIEDAARAVGRAPDELTTIVVTKFHPASLVRELAALGVRDIGENRHQEAAGKAAELSDLDLTWHFIGQLQSNKARQVRRYARVVHSIDRGSLVDAIASPDGEIIDCFVQVNLSDHPARGGVSATELEPLVERLLAAPGLKLLGVMGVAPLDEEPQRAFSRLRRESLRVQSLAPDADRISAGMSADYAAAIAEGATHLRIGSAITGNRPKRG